MSGEKGGGYSRAKPWAIRGWQGGNRYITMEGQGGELMQAHYVKCRAKNDIKDPRSITMKNGKPATQGTCSMCGAKMFRIGKS